MNSSFISLLGICLFGLVSANTIRDGHWNMDDSLPVKIDGEEQRQPLIRPSLNDKCNRISLEIMTHELDSDDGSLTPEQESKRETVETCKQKLEKDVLDAVAKLDNLLKERINRLVESLIVANGGKGFDRRRSTMPGTNKQISEVILKTIEQRGTDLSTIKTYDQFKRVYRDLQTDCNEVNKDLNQLAWDYRAILDSDKFQPEPIVAQWVQNANVCEYLTADPSVYSYYGSRAYMLLEEKAGH